ncbi:hypothetical protein CPC08DRAFT_687886 [Agrocybe pediades]|nr:hypothetical protein CPC08DRAFT_687886 [Agrocybe pediades]
MNDMLRDTSKEEEDHESSTLLGKREDENIDSEVVGNRMEVSSKQAKLGYYISAALISILFLIDMIAFILVIRMLLDANTIGSEDTLEFRNPYIGLDELYTSGKVKSSTYSRLVNEPRFATQISSADPDRVFPVDLHRWLTDFGFVSPSDRRLKVSTTVSTIAQFHVLDYGMERCALAVRLPKRGDILPHPYSLPVSHDAVALDICELSVSRPLEEQALSFAARPPCLRKLATLQARVGEEVETPRFDCKSGSFLAYQISCVGSEESCDIDVWSNQNATWGFYINQYQTL